MARFKPAPKGPQPTFRFERAPGPACEFCGAALFAHTVDRRGRCLQCGAQTAIAPASSSSSSSATTKTDRGETAASAEVRETYSDRPAPPRPEILPE